MAKIPAPNMRAEGVTASRRSPMLRLLIATLVGLLAGFSLFVFFGGDDQPNGADDATESAGASAASRTTLELGDEAAMKCMVPTPALLQEQEIAFEGTVASIKERAVTLDVTTWFQGEPTDQVVLRTADPQLRLALSGVDFTQGETYLVSANEGSVTMCGFSGQATPELAALFAEAYPS